MILEKKIEHFNETDSEQKPMNSEETLYILEQLERSRIMKNKPPLIIDYTNIAIIFGYIGMFSTILPIAPSIAFFGFYWKLKTDVKCISTIYKRVPAE